MTEPFCSVYFIEIKVLKQYSNKTFIKFTVMDANQIYMYNRDAHKKHV